jgi:hypothetical protein
MRIEKDFKEFIESLNRSEVRYLIVGGFAYSYYVEARFTKDIDFFIEVSEENASRLMKALTDFGFGQCGLKEEDFRQSDRIIQLGYAPVRIDIVTSIPGVEFQAAWENRVLGHYGGIPTWFISKADLIRNKKATGRKIDLADVEKLEAM